MQTPIPGYGKKRRPRKGAPTAGTGAAAEEARRPYYKLATWSPRLGCFKDGKGYPTMAAAMVDARKKPGRYRISRVEAGERMDGEPFEVR